MKRLSFGEFSVRYHFHLPPSDYLPSIMVPFTCAPNTLDALVDVLSFISDISSSLADVCESLGDVASKPTTWSRNRAEDESTYIGKGVWSSVQLELDKRDVKRYDWTYAALRVYRPYRVLEAERKNAKCVDKERQTISFLDLPGEIRTQIYKLALVFDGIEIETRLNHLTHIVSCGDQQNKRNKHWCPWCPGHYRTWSKTVRPALGLLRLNKQINAEAASIFYGHNEFRFTSPNGRDTLEAFCKTIGEANTRRLAKITHHVTFDNRVDCCSCLSNHKLKRRFQISQACYQRLPVCLCKSNTAESRISQERRENVPAWVKWTGMHMQGTIQSQNPVDFDFARALTDDKGGLREYRLVLPHDLRIKHEDIARYLRCIFDHVANPYDGTSGIKITLVLLDKKFRALDRLISMANLALNEEYQLRCEFVELALEWGWEVVMANAVDKATGNYVYSAPLGSVDEFIRRVNYEVTRVPHKGV